MTVEIMGAVLAALALIGGALLCLLASVGVLRLPDVFTRLHAATKAGVVGTGLVLVGVAAIDGTLATWIKIVVAVFFLLATTPVAGHVLGRAAYLSGASTWSGTAADHLAAVLRRGRFEPGSFEPPLSSLPKPGEARVDRVVLALAHGPRLGGAIEKAISLAEAHEAELVGVALIDTAALAKDEDGVTAEARAQRLELARKAAAEAMQRFESAAKATQLVWSVRLEEGSVAKVLEEVGEPFGLVVMADGAWFDQGVLRMENVERCLARAGLRERVHVLR